MKERKKTTLGISDDTEFYVRKRGSKDVAKIIGERIGLYRYRRELTQQQLADRYGISKNALCNYEKGKIVPPLEVIFDIAAELSMTLDEFFGIKEPQMLSIKEEVVLEYYKSASPKAQEVILETVRNISNAFPAENDTTE